MRIAVCPGTFDPVTLGHLDIITRTTQLFDWVYVAILKNPSKVTLFDKYERLEMLRDAVAHLPRVSCELFDGLVVNYARQRSACAIVRGLRAISDFEFEFELASMNRRLAPEVETVFMMTSNEYSFLSSSAVKEIASFGGDVHAWVPPLVAERLKRKFSNAAMPERPPRSEGGPDESDESAHAAGQH